MGVAIDVFSVLLMVSGALFMLVAGIGVLRFDDVYLRMHAAGKPATLGVALVMGGAALQVPVGAAAKLGVVVFLQFLTVSVGTHLMSRAAHHAGVRMGDHAVVDDLEPVDHPRDEQQPRVR